MRINNTAKQAGYRYRQEDGDKVKARRKEVRTPISPAPTVFAEWIKEQQECRHDDNSAPECRAHGGDLGQKLTAAVQRESSPQ